MQVSFEPTRADQIEAALYWQKHSSGYKRPVWKYLLIGLVAGAVLAYFNSDDWILTFVIFVVIYGGLAIYGVKFGQRRILEKAYSKSKGLLMYGQRTVTLHSEYLTSESVMSRGDFRWDVIGLIDRTPDYIFIEIDGVSVLPIPRQAFDSDGNYEAFYQMAVENRQACMSRQPDLSRPAPWRREQNVHQSSDSHS